MGHAIPFFPLGDVLDPESRRQIDYSYTRIKQPAGTMGIYVTGVADIKKVDDHTVDFIMAAPNPILLRNSVSHLRTSVVLERLKESGVVIASRVS